MQNTYRVKITETMSRTIEIEVVAMSEEQANANGIREARDIQPVGWNYTWTPIASKSEIVSSN